MNSTYAKKGKDDRSNDDVLQLCNCAYYYRDHSRSNAGTIKFFSEVSIVDFLTDTQWTPLFSEKHFGILPLLSGTLLTTTIAILVAVPLGLIIAVYLNEYASPKFTAVVKPILEVLAAIPTVVYGFFALQFVTPLLQKIIPGLNGFNALSPGLVMGIMIVPYITSLSEDALRAVPRFIKRSFIWNGSYQIPDSI